MNRRIVIKIDSPLTRMIARESVAKVNPAAKTVAEGHNKDLRAWNTTATNPPAASDSPEPTQAMQNSTPPPSKTPAASCCFTSRSFVLAEQANHLVTQQKGSASDLTDPSGLRSSPRLSDGWNYVYWIQ